MQEFSVELEADLDQEGFLGISPAARNGFSEIRMTTHIKCNASPEEVRAYVEFVESRCPVRDNIGNGVPVRMTDVVVE